MTTENTLTENDNTELLEDAIEIVTLQNRAYYERYKLLTKAGLKLGDTKEFTRARELNGHSVLIGAQYTKIRIALGIPLETMAYKCDISVAEISTLENCGFITGSEGKFWHVTSRDSLVKDIYTASLEISLWKGKYYEPDLISFEEMVELNKAYTSDIKERLWEMEQLAPPFIVNSYKNILKAYDEIFEILAPYLEM